MIDARLRTDETLAVNPYESLRTAFGMLLGVDDFGVLMGNPRGKAMIHNAWLHGSGIVWGFAVDRDPEGRLRIGSGLAIDPIGRELFLDRPHCVDLDKWIDEQRLTDRWDAELEECDDGTHRVRACLSARFTTCLATPVPALLDPCDPTRSGHESSRFRETVELVLLLGHCPDRRGCPPLDLPDDEDRAGDPDSPARWFPVDEVDADLVLGEVCVSLRQSGGTYKVDDVDIDHSAVSWLLPTCELQHIIFDLVERLDAATADDAGGPRVITDSVRWRNRVISFKVTCSLFEASLPSNIEVRSLTGRGWVDERFVAHYADASLTVTIHLENPHNSLVRRVLLRGHGPSPIVSDSFTPLAGLDHDPPCGVEGRDAVLMSGAT